MLYSKICKIVDFVGQTEQCGKLTRRSAGRLLDCLTRPAVFQAGPSKEILPTINFDWQFFPHYDQKIFYYNDWPLLGWARLAKKIFKKIWTDRAKWQICRPFSTLKQNDDQLDGYKLAGDDPARDRSVGQDTRVLKQYKLYFGKYKEIQGKIREFLIKVRF